MGNYYKSINIFKKHDESFLFYFSIIIFVFMFYCRDVFGISIPDYIFICYSILLFFILNVNQGVAFALSFALVSNGMPITYSIAAALIAFLIKTNSYIRFSNFIVPIVLIIIWEALHQFIPPSNIVNYFSYMVVYVYMAIIVFNKNIKLNYLLIVKIFLLVGILTNFVILLQALSITGYSLSKFITSGIRLGYADRISDGSLQMLSNDPNLLAQNCALGISTSILLISKGHNKLLYSFITLTFLFFGILTLSKTFIITIVLIIIFVLLYNLYIYRKKVLKSYTFILSALSLMSIIYLLSNLLFSNAINNVLNRFRIGITEGNLTTGRIDVLSMYNDYLISNPPVLFFGLGMQDIGLKTGLIQSPHSSIQEIILIWGIVGLFLVLLFLLTLIKFAKIKGGNLSTLYNYLPLLVFLFMTQSTQLFSLRDRVMIFIIVFASLQINALNNRRGGET